jgi:peptidoglycan pentaglycine glycine transferase (the first glycine)
MSPIEEAERADWDTFAAAHPRGDLLHAWAWGEVAAWRGERPYRLGLRDAAGALRAIAQVLVRPTLFGRSVVYVPHGPLWDARDPSALETLLDAIADLARQEHAIVVKLDPRGDGLSDPELASLRAGLTGRDLREARQFLQAPVTQIIDLRGGDEAIRRGWHQLARRNVARAEREGVATRIVRDIDLTAIEAFHGVHDETAHRAGFAPRSVAFLQQLASGFAPGGGWYLCLAEKDGHTIGGMVAIRFGDRAYYLYGGSSGDPALRDARPGYATMAGLMAALASDGVTALDTWGISDDPRSAAVAESRREGGAAGGRQSWGGFSFFKQRFGGTEVHHVGTFDLVVSPAWNALRDLGERVRTLLRRS